MKWNLLRKETKSTKVLCRNDFLCYDVNVQVRAPWWKRWCFKRPSTFPPLRFCLCTPWPVTKQRGHRSRWVKRRQPQLVSIWMYEPVPDQNAHACSSLCSGVGGAGAGGLAAPLWTAARQHCRPQRSATRQCSARCVCESGVVFLSIFHYAVYLICPPPSPSRQGGDVRGHTCRLQGDASLLGSWVPGPSAGCHGESSRCFWWRQADQRRSKAEKTEMKEYLFMCICLCFVFVSTNQINHKKKCTCVGY